MPAVVSSLVPARFLTITAHLVIVITIFWSRDNNVKAGLPLDFTQEQYDKEDTDLVVGLSVTLGLFAVELAGFFSATAVHASASVALLFFLFEQWDCDIYWWILAICSPGPPLQCIRLLVILCISTVGMLDILGYICHLQVCSPTQPRV
ncbi:Transmembrane protein 107 [Merluccius polli]|uniref:Transmembrane protein 107 n=1 Tax=Merluccius polli TaxID=89951 RepID=A0AA47P047_MERPO|nr:Transmembrane protein 107 [Merluccius polli]